LIAVFKGKAVAKIETQYGKLMTDASLPTPSKQKARFRCVTSAL